MPNLLHSSAFLGTGQAATVAGRAPNANHPFRRPDEYVNQIRICLSARKVRLRGQLGQRPRTVRSLVRSTVRPVVRPTVSSFVHSSIRSFRRHVL